MQKIIVQINKEPGKSSEFRVVSGSGVKNKVTTISNVTDTTKFIKKLAGNKPTTLSITSSIGDTPYSRSLASLIKNSLEESVNTSEVTVDIFFDEDTQLSDMSPSAKELPVVYLSVQVGSKWYLRDKLHHSKPGEGESGNVNTMKEYASDVSSALENIDVDTNGALLNIVIHYKATGITGGFIDNLASYVETEIKKDYGSLIKQVSIVNKGKQTPKEPGIIFNIAVNDIPENGVSNVMMFPYIGEFKDSECTQVLDKTAAEQLAATYNGKEFLVDQEHWSYSKDGSTMALGWCKGIVAGDDGCYATIKWTPTGQKMINGGEYRYVSGVWYLDKDNRPKIIESVGLTNKPRIKGSKPIPV